MLQVRQVRQARGEEYHPPMEACLHHGIKSLLFSKFVFHSSDLFSQTFCHHLLMLSLSYHFRMKYLIN